METGFSQLTWALVRVVFGLSLAFFHGYAKVFGGKIGGFTKIVADLGFPSPQFFAWAASLSEFVGGILVAIGLATRGAASFAAFVMAVALYRHRHGPWTELELPLLYFSVMVLAIAFGGGRYSLDASARVRSPVTRR